MDQCAPPPPPPSPSADPLHVMEGITLEGLHQTLQGGNLDPKEVCRSC
jgi:hypothetical protein